MLNKYCAAKINISNGKMSVLINKDDISKEKSTVGDQEASVYIFATELAQVAFVRAAAIMVRKNTPSAEVSILGISPSVSASLSGRVLLTSLMSDLHSAFGNYSGATSSGCNYRFAPTKGNLGIPKNTVCRLSTANCTSGDAKVRHQYDLLDRELAGEEITSGTLTPMGRAYTKEIPLNSSSSIEEFIAAYLVSSYPHAAYLVCVGDSGVASKALGAGLCNWRLAIANKIFGYMPSYPILLASFVSYFKQESSICFRKIYAAMINHSATALTDKSSGGKIAFSSRGVPLTMINGDFTESVLTDKEYLASSAIRALCFLNTRLASSSEPIKPVNGWLGNRQTYSVGAYTYTDSSSLVENPYGPDALIALMDNPPDHIKADAARIGCTLPAKNCNTELDILYGENPVTSSDYHKDSLGLAIGYAETAYINLSSINETGILDLLTEEKVLTLKYLYGRVTARNSLLREMEYELNKISTKIKMLSSKKLDSTVIQAMQYVPEATEALKKRAAQTTAYFRKMSNSSVLKTWRFRHESSIDLIRQECALGFIKTYLNGGLFSPTVCYRPEISVIMLYELLTTGCIKKPALPISISTLLNYDDSLASETNVLKIADSVREAYTLEYYWNSISNGVYAYKNMLYKSIQGVVSPFLKLKGFLQASLDAVSYSLAGARFGGYCSTDIDCLSNYPLKMHHAGPLKSIEVSILLKSNDNTTISTVTLWDMQEVSAAVRIVHIADTFNQCGGIKSVFVPGTFSDCFQGSQFLQNIGNYTSAGHDLFANVLFSITDLQASYARGENHFSLVTVTDVHLINCLDILGNLDRLSEVASGLGLTGVSSVCSVFNSIVELLKVAGDIYCASDPYYDSTVARIESFFTEKKY